ncbi:MAG TPA: enoyl-CoA hydratase-related protein [Phenylobacterium sp.]|nr:enoyl-CoA hydratase-related protein [Phenylobacterium sp.]
MSSYDYCTVEDQGPVRLVTLNRPDVMNALHTAAHEELEQVWDEFARRDDLWVAIVTGAGERAFCAGNDLRAQAASGPVRLARTGFAGLTSRYDLDKPIIAAVNGVAMGGGFEIALACDLVVASEAAIFALPEPRVGLIAGAGGLHRLPRMIPQKQALGMILTGRRVSAAEGAVLGFVNEVTPPGDLLPVARRWADLILECSPMAIKASKQTINRGFDADSLEVAIATIYPAHAANRASEDYVEGPRAFMEKRKPAWRNR